MQVGIRYHRPSVVRHQWSVLSGVNRLPTTDYRLPKTNDSGWPERSRRDDLSAVEGYNNPVAKKKTQSSHKLYRSRDDRVFAGVAGGFAHYLDIDPTFVRAMFIIAFLAGGVGSIMYFIFWVMIPLEPEGGIAAPTKEEKEQQNFATTLLIIFGVIVTAKVVGLLRFLSWSFLLPIFLIGVGAYYIMKEIRNS